MKIRGNLAVISRSGGAIMAEQDIADLAQLYRSTGSIRGVWEAVGRKPSIRAVYRRLQLAGVVFRPQGRPSRPGQPVLDLVEEIITDMPVFPEGASLNEIIEWLGEEPPMIVEAFTEAFRVGRIRIAPI